MFTCGECYSDPYQWSECLFTSVVIHSHLSSMRKTLIHLSFSTLALCHLHGSLFILRFFDEEFWARTTRNCQFRFAKTHVYPRPLYFILFVEQLVCINLWDPMESIMRSFSCQLMSIWSIDSTGLYYNYSNTIQIDMFMQLLTFTTSPCIQGFSIRTLSIQRLIVKREYTVHQYSIKIKGIATTELSNQISQLTEWLGNVSLFFTCTFSYIKNKEIVISDLSFLTCRFL